MDYFNSDDLGSKGLLTVEYLASYGLFSESL
jgi:hypothetical protein